MSHVGVIRGTVHQGSATECSSRFCRAVAEADLSEPESIEQLISETLGIHSGFRPSGAFRPGPAERWFCGCGEQIDDEPSGRGVLFRHRAHVAAALHAALREDGWTK